MDGRINANKERSKVSDVELKEACKTMTINEIVEKYGMHHSSIRRRCRENGWTPVGYGNTDYRSITMKSVNARGLGNNVRIFGDCWHYINNHDKICKEKHPGFVYLESRTKKAVRLKCKTCGNIVERSVRTFKRSNVIECEYCREKKQQQEDLRNERIKLIRSFCAILEQKKPKACKICGKEFYSQYPQAAYCSDKCRKNRKGSSIRKRCRKYGVLYDPSVSAVKIFQRDHYKCAICGIDCIQGDDTWSEYCGPYAPTVDHIIPLAKGGTHTWENVQCAHAICNSYKRDLIV